MRCVLLLALASASAFATDNDDSPILPTPPVDVTTLARAEYQKAEQAFVARDYVAAERALQASWHYQRNHVTLYDLAAVRIRMGKLAEAADDMLHYFGWAPSPDPNHDAAIARLERIAKLRHLRERGGCRCATDFIAACKAGKCGNSPRLLDECLDKTQDPALFYWVVVYEYGQPTGRPRAGARNAEWLDSMRRMLLAYFAAAEDRADLFDAQRLYDEVDNEWRRAVMLEQRTKLARGGR